jgi:holo-[acyl-carrier protein] synthase
MDEWLEKTLPYGAQWSRAQKRQLAKPGRLINPPEVVGESAIGLGDELIGGEPVAVTGVGGDLPGTDAEQDAGAPEPDDAGPAGGGPQPEVVVLGDAGPVPAGIDESAAAGESGGMRVGVVEEQSDPPGLLPEGYWQRWKPEPGADDLEGGEDQIGSPVDGGELGGEPPGEADVVGVHAGYELAFRLIEKLGEGLGDTEVLGGGRELDPSISDTADKLGRSVVRRIIENQDLGIVGQGAQGRAESGFDGVSGVPRRDEDAEAWHQHSFSQGLVNPAVNPTLRAPSPATWRRALPRLRTGPPAPEGSPMPRTPERAAPRHAPRIRIGCDVHPISEIAESIELFGERYLGRVFTPVERAQTAGPMSLERLAGRFAAKEAVLKVLQVPSTAAVPWQSIEVRTGRNGIPYVVLDGAAKSMAEGQGISRIDISLSHDGGIAMAVAAAIPSDTGQPSITAGGSA